MIIFIDSQSSMTRIITFSILSQYMLKKTSGQFKLTSGMPFAVSHYLLSRYSTMEGEGDDGCQFMFAKKRFSF